MSPRSPPAASTSIRLDTAHISVAPLMRPETAPASRDLEPMGLSGYLELKKTNPGEDPEQINEKKWKKDVLDLARVFSLSQTIFLLLEHNNEAMLRVCVEIATDRIKRKCLWWPQTWFTAEEMRDDFQTIVTDKLYKILGWMSSLPTKSEKKPANEEDDGAKQSHTSTEVGEEKAAKEKCKRAEARLREVEESLDAAKEKIFSLEKKLEAMRRATMRRGEAEGDDSEAGVDKLEAAQIQLEETRRKSVRLQGDLSEAQQELFQKQAEIDRLRAELESSGSAKIAELERKLKETQQMLKDHDREHKTAMEMEMAHAKGEAKAELELAKKAEAKAKAELTTLQEALRKAEEALKQALAGQPVVTTTTTDSAALHEAEARAALAERQRDEADKRAQRLSDDLAAALESKGLCPKCGGKSKVKSSATEELTGLQAQLDALQAKFDKKKAEVTALQEEKEAWEAERMKLLKMLHKLKEQLDKAKEMAAKKGYGNILDDIFEESEITVTLQSTEMRCFMRLYGDALKRMERNRTGAPAETRAERRNKTQTLRPEGEGQGGDVSVSPSTSPRYISGPDASRGSIGGSRFTDRRMSIANMGVDKLAIVTTSLMKGSGKDQGPFGDSGAIGGQSDFSQTLPAPYRAPGLSRHRPPAASGFRQATGTKQALNRAVNAFRSGTGMGPLAQQAPLPAGTLAANSSAAEASYPSQQDQRQPSSGLNQSIQPQRGSPRPSAGAGGSGSGGFGATMPVGNQARQATVYGGGFGSTLNPARLGGAVSGPSPSTANSGGDLGARASADFLGGTLKPATSLGGNGGNDLGAMGDEVINPQPEIQSETTLGQPSSVLRALSAASTEHCISPSANAAREILQASQISDPTGGSLASIATASVVSNALSDKSAKGDGGAGGHGEGLGGAAGTRPRVTISDSFEAESGLGGGAAGGGGAAVGDAESVEEDQSAIFGSLDGRGGAEGFEGESLQEECGGDDANDGSEALAKTLHLGNRSSQRRQASPMYQSEPLLQQAPIQPDHGQDQASPTFESESSSQRAAMRELEGLHHPVTSEDSKAFIRTAPGASHRGDSLPSQEFSSQQRLLSAGAGPKGSGDIHRGFHIDLSATAPAEAKAASSSTAPAVFGVGPSQAAGGALFPTGSRCLVGAGPELAPKQPRLRSLKLAHPRGRQIGGLPPVAAGCSAQWPPFAERNDMKIQGSRGDLISRPSTVESATRSSLYIGIPGSALARPNTVGSARPHEACFVQGRAGIVEGKLRRGLAVRRPPGSGRRDRLERRGTGLVIHPGSLSSSMPNLSRANLASNTEAYASPTSDAGAEDRSWSPSRVTLMPFVDP